MAEIRGTLIQYFHWYSPNEGTLWNELNTNAKMLKDKGFTAVWLPPACKGMFGINDVGYGIYDLFDFGEFNQKGTVRTKYGTKEEYRQAIVSAQKVGLHIYADVVLNHKMGADAKQKVQVRIVDPKNRNKFLSELHEKELWTAYSFPGRGDKYSSMKWQWWHFDATKEYGKIYKMKDKQFETHVDTENDNYDFLMGCDLDFDDAQVRGEVHYWGKWYLDNFGVDGFRIDAIKHIRSFFFKYWLDDMRKHTGKSLFAVGEYWSHDLARLQNYIDETEGKMALFDVPLHYNFHSASHSGAEFNMGAILDNTLVKANPLLAVTMVDNHDTQPLQSLESFVEDWFKPLAYAIILLRDEGYPCVFGADYFGASYIDSKNGQRRKVCLTSHKEIIDVFMEARQRNTFGVRRDYFDHNQLIGWTFEGDDLHKSMAVVMSNCSDGAKWMETGKADVNYRDITGHVKELTGTDQYGRALFRTLAKNISVWVEQES